MPLKEDVNYPGIDVAKTTDKIHEEMSALVVDACRTFVFATTDVIPVLTGGTKASFLKLAHEVKVGLEISPRRGNRIPLGIESSTGEVFTEKGKRYGFSWESDLYYIGYVHSLVVPFLEFGLSVVERMQVGLPAPVIHSSNDNG